MEIDKSKKILENTLFLYFRTLMTMVISLFTVRIVYNALGVEDYGIFNVVGGIVVMLSFFVSTLNSSSMRFFAFELGRKNFIKLNQYFVLSIYSYIGFGLILLLIAETFGLWFLGNYLNIPDNRIIAAKWVYHFSIFTFLIHLIQIPYTALIIANEKMKIYAYASILEVSLKLIIVYLLDSIDYDKLILYSILLFIVSIITTCIYIIYTIIKIKESKLKLFWNKEMFRNMMAYSGWSLFGAFAGMVRSQGINILLNIFFNPIINASRAIAFQVNNALNSFVSNFYLAVRPQITKSYAAGNHDEMQKFVFSTSRYCFYLIMLLSIPILLETTEVLSIWLGNVPNFAVLFTRLVIITTIIESISYPLMAAINATGNIKFYQLITGGMLVLNLPVSYTFLKLGYPPQITMYVSMAIAFGSQISRVFFMAKMHNMPIRTYIKDVLIRIIGVTIFTSIAPLLISKFIYINFYVKFVFLFLVTVIIGLINIYYIGITKEERVLLNKAIALKLSGFNK